ncbi:fibrous sheath CABYR-binding protein [Musca domestica]|uniref:Fibrous sheath CABYR-binding protein isoform X1 n=1 Tax=Musca domestica TaxID=7370 RepID=A0A1I8MQE1_MUSDO|nr:fibrous sheath CABYR-binding protein [Musca domestica]
MWKFSVLLICLSGYCLAGPVGLKKNIPIGLQQRANDANTENNVMAAEAESPADMSLLSTLTLPSNATSIRADITDNFSCENKPYGYYADVENDCQIFHVCLPVTYADGKENTFRWSFICPEETVFSQDSFTCMRPEDMAISCEESLNYYELNRNFGMVQPEAEKENNEVAEAETQPEIAVQPVVIMPEPVQAVEQPIKTNRRKPGLSFAAQKKPAYPLRKVPQTQPEMTAIATEQQASENTEIAQEVQEDEIKPVVQKFSRRPVPVMSNSFKDKIQNAGKPENVNSLRADLFNQKRKRPTMFNKKPLEEAADEVTLVEDKVSEQSFSPLESAVPVTNTETQVADAEIEASQTQEVFVKPEEPQVESEKPVQVLEAFEEIPAVIAEVEEPAQVESEAVANNEDEVVAEVPAIELTQNEEEVHAEAPEDIQVQAEETKSNQDEKTEDETPVVPEPEEEVKTADETDNVAQTEEEEPAQEIAESNAEEESKTTQDSAVDAEEQKSAEEPQSAEETQSAEEVVPVVVEEEIQAAEDIKPAQENINAEEVQTSDEVASASAETQVAEEDVPVADSKDEVKSADEEVAVSSETAEETVVNAEDAKSTEDVQTVEGEQVADEIQTAEEPQAEEEPQAVEEPKAVEEIQPAEEDQPVKEAQAAEEVQTSDEVQTAVETQNSEETQTVDELPVVANMEQAAAASEETQTSEEVKSVPENVIVEEDQEADVAPVAEETQAVETVAEDEVKESEPTVVKSENNEEPLASEENSPALEQSEVVPEEEVAEEIKPVIESETQELQAEAEEVNPVQEEEEAQDVHTPEIVAEESSMPEDVKSEESEASPLKENVNEDAKSTLPAQDKPSEPAIFEENSEEIAAAPVAQTIEEMEAEKPVEAPESMPATDEMTVQDPMVEQMLEESNADETKKQSIGGFKPVDPAMAAEAEQLIADFINTLRRNDFTNEKPGMPMGMPIPAADFAPEPEQVSEEDINKVLAAQEILEQADNAAEEMKSEDQPQIFEAQSASEEDKSVDNEEETRPDVEEEKETSFLKSTEVQGINAAEEEEKPVMLPVTVPELIMSHVPQQIPVEIVASPVEDEPQQQEEQENASDNVDSEMPATNEEEQNEKEEQAVFMGGYKPLSIDDIVELVKERLDQKPKDDMETPMQLEQVLGEAKPNAEEPSGVEESDSAAEQHANESQQQSEEEIVMPIYHRSTEPLKVDAAVQTNSHEESAAAVEAAEAPSTQDKSNRSLRSRSMLNAKLDPRKRRFLFRSDES